MDFLFYFFAVLIILSSIFVVGSNNPVHAVLFFIIALLNSVVLFIFLNAEFIAMMVLIVYIGAVVVLFLFVVMMLDLNHVKLYSSFINKYLVIGSIVCTMFFFIIGFVILNSNSNIKNFINYNINNVNIIGNLLYTDYMYVFHLSGILLLVAVIGSIVLTLQDKKKIGIKRQNVFRQLMQSSSVKIIKVSSKKGIEWKK